tara:strand:- start:2993 stop:7282 length:4290 start_codon:yes stop_codon:yes gene_type:complete
MKKQLIAIILGATTMLWSNDALSYKKDSGKSTGSNGGGSNATINAKGANCSPATASITMNFNDVSAFIEQGGSMFQNRQEGVAAYEVGGDNLFAIYAGALWMGGTDVNGQLKLAALKFRQGNDFWPGPLTVTPGTGDYNPSQPIGDGAIRDFGEANIDPDQCLFYDKFYTIRKAEVIQYTIWWECENGVLLPEDCLDVIPPSDEVLARITSWPAHGRVDLGQDYWLAPFYDRDGSGDYNATQGDTPWFDDILDRDDVECGFDRRITLYGDECHWWVFNDKGNIHTETNGEPIGMEIRAQAFAFATNDEVNRMTFYNYEMINRGTQTLFDTYFSQYLDCDVGNYTDDYVGCDVSRGLGYTYNADALDETASGNQGYGENPPAIGCDFFEGPYQDADGRDNVGPYIDPATNLLVTPTVNAAIADTGIVYKGIGVGYSDSIIDNERFGMRRFTYYTAAASYPQSDPNSAAEFYNFMSGTWANGSEMFYGGTGAAGSPGVTTTPSDYMFPGDSDPLRWGTAGTDLGFDWSESDPGNGTPNPGGDRRFVQSAGPFTLKPGATNNITVGIVYGRGSDGDPFSSVNAMRSADTKAQALFDACFKILSPPAAPRLIIQELENQLVLMIDNPTSSNNYEEGYAEKDEINITDPGVDQFYRFEGYQIYQMIDSEAGVGDITDVSKARLVAQCDVKNGVDRLINFEFDEDLGFSIPVEKVDGSDDGIKHTFLIQEDEFAQGDKILVNHKEYFFIATAYAYNAMADLNTGAPFLYDPNDPLLLQGQKIPYISSFLSYDGAAITSVLGVPHNPTPEADGTSQNIAYGSSPIITRLDGHGNGNRALELTQESKDIIIKDGYMETPSYDYGKGPINIKVVDPLNVADGQFECRFRDYNVSQRNGADTASWIIIRSYMEDGVAMTDSITSSLTIASQNEQIIPDWGVSVEIHQNLYFDPAGSSGGTEVKTTDLISSSIDFEDSSKIWLSLVSDNDAFYPTNWIRSGTYTTDDFGNDPSDCIDPTAAFYRDYLDPCNYKDWNAPANFADPDKQWSSILGGGIAPHKVVGYEASFMPMAYYNYATPTSAKNAASISFLPSVDIVITSDKSLWTRCPIIELGRSAALNVGGAEPGEMRKSTSVNKEGTTAGETTTGMGWFPGYAIDLESGARLYMAFGENSFLVSENGADMIWNPTSSLVDNGGTPLLGGMHPVYVYSYNNKTINNYIVGYDHPAYTPALAENLATNQLYQDMLLVEANNTTQKRYTYGSISWVAYPLAAPGYTIDPNNIETDVQISLRVSKEYKNFTATGQNGGLPMYSWDMADIATEVGSQDQLVSAMDMINVVPNPYYAYSEYERNRLDTKVKITNLPERCTVKIYSTNGKLVKTFKKDNPITSIDWDLNNFRGIPVAGGVYLIHVNVPSIDGSEPLTKVLKFFGGMRQIDLQGI